MQGVTLFAQYLRSWCLTAEHYLKAKTTQGYRLTPEPRNIGLNIVQLECLFKIGFNRKVAGFNSLAPSNRIAFA